ncbi:MAG: hypothetical protein AAF483_23780 [Planctomycetota bacterium]
MNRNFERIRSARATALLAVLWVIGILSILVFTSSQFLFSEIEQSAANAHGFRAEQLADTAIALAANPAVERWDPILRAQLSDTEAYEARIVSEGARLHLNSLLGDEIHHQVLRDLFQLWGLGPEQSIAVVDSLADWVDQDQQLRAAGAERELYGELGLQGRPYNRDFIDLDEARLVLGMDLVAAAKPDWRQAFTLHSGGKLDLNDAPPQLIQALCQCPLEVVLRFDATRKGADGLVFTEDDVRFQSVTEALNALGAGGDLQLLESRATVNDSVTRLIGIGIVGDFALERSVVVRSRSSQPVVLDVESRRFR